MKQHFAQWISEVASRLQRIVLPLWMGLTIMTSTAPTVSADQLQGLANPTLALNPTAIQDYNPGLQFLDIMKMARPWIGHEPGQWGGMTTEELQESGHLDAEGWPTEIPEGLEKIGTVWDWSGADEASRKTGVYVLEYEGEGTLNIRGDAEILSSEPGRIVFENHEGGTLILDILETDPEGTGDYIRDISIVKEENLPLYEAGAVFNPEWLELIDDARELRFMFWNDTIDSKIVSWDERITPDSAPVGSAVALEHMVQLANEVGADAWFTIPHLADEEYIRNFATYVRDHLDPDLTVRVEYSNENWNWAFPVTHWLLDQSKAEWGEEAYIDYHAKKAVETALIWQDVFGDEADSRLVNVLGTQTGNLGLTQRLLDPEVWREQEPDSYVDPATVFEELAVTTYFGSATVRVEEMRDELIDAIKDPSVDAQAFLYEKLLDPEYMQSIPQITEFLKQNAAIAHEYGLKLSSYEGGQHVHHSFAVAGLNDSDKALLTEFMTEFARSGYMADLYEKSWQSWAEISDGAYMQFGDVAAPSKWGSFSMYENLDTPTERGAVLEELNETETPWWDAEGGEQYQQGVIKQGTEGADQLAGTSQEDYLLGGDGDDVFVPGQGNDGINGGAGTDRVVLAGRAGEYTVEKEGDGYRVTGPDGSNFLINVEELQFDEGDVATLEALLQNSDGKTTLPDTSAPDPVEEGQKGESGSSDADQAESGVPAAKEPGPVTVGVQSDGEADMTVTSINPWSALGKALGLVGDSSTPAYLAYRSGARIEIDGRDVDASYWSLEENRATQEGALLTDDPVTTAKLFGSILQGADMLVATSGNDRFFGRGEDNHVRAGAGNDFMDGRAGDDTLRGGAGWDTVRGNDGDDVLVGGGGDDQLRGGAGQDSFLFAAGHGQDEIQDFSQGDQLLLWDFLPEGMGLDAAIRHENGNTMISNGTDSITLTGVGEGDMEWLPGTIRLMSAGERPGDIDEAPEPEDVEKTPVTQDERSAHALFRLLESDPDAVDVVRIPSEGGSGMMVQAVSVWSALGAALDLAKDGSTPAYAAFAKGTVLDFEGELVKADYWSIQENKASRDGPSLSGDALATAESFGSVLQDAKIVVTGEGNDHFLGRDEDNHVRTGAGGDYLGGRGGDDILDGGAGMDTIRGHDGDDVIFGSTDGDHLNGNDGSDSFLFGAGDGADLIVDFSAVDRLLLRDYFGSGQATLDQDAGMTVISNGTDSITLQGVGTADREWLLDRIEILDGDEILATDAVASLFSETATLADTLFG